MSEHGENHLAHWRLGVAPSALSWREWSGETVLRNGATGSTHQLGPLASAIFRALLASPTPVTSHSLAASVGTDGIDSGGDPVRAVDRALAELERIGVAGRMLP